MSQSTFAASANVILYENAEPVFIDSNLDNWTVDVEACELAIKKYKPKVLNVLIYMVIAVIMIQYLIYVTSGVFY